MYLDMRNKRAGGFATDCGYIRIQLTGSNTCLSNCIAYNKDLGTFWEYIQCKHDTISCVTYCAITLNRILLLLNDPLFHPSFPDSLPPALNQTMHGAVRRSRPAVHPPKWDLTILNTVVPVIARHMYICLFLIIYLLLVFCVL